jgi:hypothetical protein
MIGALLPALVPILGDALKRLFPDADQPARAARLARSYRQWF